MNNITIKPLTLHENIPQIMTCYFFETWYITLQTLVVWSVIDRTLQWTRPRRKSIASTSIVETCQKYGHDICRENSE